MAKNNFLKNFEKASRYLGNEINSFKKEFDDKRTKVALCFPDTYEIASSYLGLKILYEILNSQKDILAERVFAPFSDLENYLRKNKKELFSLESKKELQNFDILGFSILHELAYTNILLMLDCAKIPFYAKKRDETFPLIIAGGPACFNPEPFCEFFDAIIIGDGEEIFLKICHLVEEYKKEKFDKTNLLKKLSKLEGIYIPSFFEPVYKDDVFRSLSFGFEDYKKVKKTIIKDLNFLPTSPIVPYSKPVHDRLSIEVARGCSAGCRFCLAGYIYRPVRERSLEDLLKLAQKAIEKTGYDEISLLSLSVGDYSQLLPLISHLFSKCHNTSISLPSIRANRLSSDLAELIRSVRKTGFTIAPEAGSERLRKIINKKLSNKDILDAVNLAFKFGWKLIKLYFIIGLPYEEQEDIDEIICLIQEIAKIKGAKINVSITNFVPKAQTAFQWEPQITVAEAMRKFLYIKEKLRQNKNVKYSFHDPAASFIEALMAKGDRRLSSLIVKAYEKGAKFDSWNDSFNFDYWQEALNELGIKPLEYTNKKMDLDARLAWDHIDSLVSKDFLIKENKMAQEEKQSYDCRYKECLNCGVCDFKDIKPVLFKENSQAQVNLEKYDGKYKKLSFYFSKISDAKFLSHLEIANVFLRAIRRAKIKMKYSSGFHPMPKISFDSALPVGIEAVNERFNLEIQDNDNLKKAEILKDINKQLPPGLKIIFCLDFSKENQNNQICYLVSYNKNFDQEKLSYFENQESFFAERKNKEINLKDFVKKIDFLRKNKIKITLVKNINPFFFIKNIFNLNDEEFNKTKIIKKHKIRT